MARKGERASHCKNGHPFTAETSIMVVANRRGRRESYQRCRICLSARRRSPAVRDYMRRYQLEQRYGLTVEEFDALLVEQEGRCALCEVRGAVDVDHDHETGRVRGLLCRGCNVALGVLGDSPEAIQKVVRYLLVDQEAVV